MASDTSFSQRAEKFLKGMDFTTITEEEEKKRETEERERQKKEAFRSSGVGEKYLEYTLDDFKTDTDEQRSALDAVRTYIQDIRDGKPRSLWLTGTPGTGKTMLACLLTKELGGRYRKSYRLINEARQADSFSGSEDRNTLIDRYAGYRHLVIDEVGKDTGYKSDEWNILWQILNERYEQDKPTVLVSNLTKRELAEYLGAHIVDRFTETCRVIEFTGSSYRKVLRRGTDDNCKD